MKMFIKVLRNYANFEGRANRSEYWYFILFYYIFYIILYFIADAERQPLITLFYSLAMFIPSIAAGVRRVHDVNKSGWFIIIPFYNLVLLCTPGTVGRNDYGPDPNSTEPEFDFEKESAEGA